MGMITEMRERVSDRVKRGILAWANRTNGFVTEWAADQWAAQLAERSEPEDKIIEHMAYLVSINEKPHLTTLIKSLERGIQREWSARQEMFSVSTDGVSFFQRCIQAIDAPDHWKALLEVCEYGRKKAPSANWTDAETECREKMGSVRTDENPREVDSEGVDDDLTD